MNWLDVAVLIVLAAFALRGFLKGLVAESLGFLGLLIAAIASLYVNPMAAGQLRRPLGISRPLAAAAAAVLVFLAAEFVWHLGIYFLLGRRRKDSFRRSGANRLGGAIFGVGEGLILASLALVVLAALPMPQAYRTAAEGAEMAARVRAAAPWIGGRVATVLPLGARRRYEAFRAQMAHLREGWRLTAPSPAVPKVPAAAAGGPAATPPRSAEAPSAPPQAGTAGEPLQPPAKARP